LICFEPWLISQFLVAAIESLSRHKPFFTSKVSEVLFSGIASRGEGKCGGAEPGQRLTAREREIVQLLAEGKSNKAVADNLGISVRTAETHRASVLRKLGLAHSRTLFVMLSATESSMPDLNAVLQEETAAHRKGFAEQVAMLFTSGRKIGPP
jgi:DNA-binding NarL/FixJ family response regulator